MPRPLPALAAPEWTPELALLVERAASALARLDARICASSMARIWYQRAAWSGVARALQLEGEEIASADHSNALSR